MKKILFFLLTTFLFSCSTSNDRVRVSDLAVEDFPQKWSLYKTTGGRENSETLEEDLEYNEYYLFELDGSFSKHRIDGEQEKLAEGSFEIVESDTPMALLLTYTTDSELIGNCTGNNEEYLYLDESGKTLLSSWWSCDGPGLFYEQVSLEK